MEGADLTGHAGVTCWQDMGRLAFGLVLPSFEAVGGRYTLL